MPTPTIITLSTIPPRFPLLGPTLHTLLRQSMPVQAIELYIPASYVRFPDWDGSLPSVPAGVTIRRCDQDLGPATKILPAARKYAGRDVDLLFCDDDKVYDRRWHARIKQAHAERPDACIVEAGDDLPDIADSARAPSRLPRASRWTKKPLSYRIMRVLSLFTLKSSIHASSGYVDILGGHGGVMVRPDWFGPEAWDIPPVLRMVDDPWLSGQLERRGIPIWLVAGVRRMRVSEAGQIDALSNLVALDHDRVRADIAAIDMMRDRYGIWSPGGTPQPPASWMSETMRQMARRALERTE